MQLDATENGASCKMQSQCSLSALAPRKIPAPGNDDLRGRSPKSIAKLPPRVGPISGFSRFAANESLRRTGLHLSFAAKSSFYLPAFEISRSCRTASTVYN